MSLLNKSRSANAFSMGDFVWWLGVIEDRNDPEKLGRVRVRIFGYDKDDNHEIEFKHLFWAFVVQPTTSSFFCGVGQSPTYLIEGTTVLGFFLDGHHAQNPVVLGTLGGNPSEKGNKKKAFTDPNEIYTRYEIGELDTNRLARGEKIDQTPVQWRKDEVDKEVKKAFEDEWDEPKTPYAAQYPYNKVFESEPKPMEDVSKKPPPENCGHIMEFDDTPGAERIYLQHKKGTFTEVHPDGTEVHKVMKDRYIVIEENDHLHIKGDGTITVDGGCKIYVEGNCDLEVKGDMHHRVHGNYKFDVIGEAELNFLKTLKIKADSDVDIDVFTNINKINVGHREELIKLDRLREEIEQSPPGGNKGDIIIKNKKNTYVTTDAHIKMKAPRIDLNP